MILAAVEQAKQRLTKAEKALTELVSATNFQEAESAWTDFLIAAATIYSKLQQGAKGSRKSEQWFGRKKGERKSDPLLAYLHQARNSNEHGVELTVGQTSPNMDGMGRKLKFNEKVGPLQLTAHDPSTGELRGEFEGWFAGPALKPIRVTNQIFKDAFDPPRTHLDKEMPFADFADGLAKQAIIYLRSLVAEAEALL